MLNDNSLKEALFSSKTDEWSSPQDLFDLLNEEFHFTLDVCADESNHKCEKFFTEEDDGLKQEWSGVCWMNPPYGREIGRWMEKAVDTMMGGGCVVCLVPSRTDTKWWHDTVMKSATGIRLIKGRLKFGKGKTSAPFPSAIVIFDGRPKQWFAIR